MKAQSALSWPSVMLPAGRRTCGFGGTVGSEQASGKGIVRVIRSLSKAQIRQPIPAALSLPLIQIWLMGGVGSGFSSVQNHPFLTFSIPILPCPHHHSFSAWRYWHCSKVTHGTGDQQTSNSK